MWIVPSSVFVARCHLMGGKLSSVQSVLTRPSVLSIPVYPSDWPNATVLQLLLYQRQTNISPGQWACSWLTKYYCTLYKHVTATLLLAQPSVLGIPMWLTNCYCATLHLLLYQSHNHPFWAYSWLIKYYRTMYVHLPLLHRYQFWA